MKFMSSPLTPLAVLLLLPLLIYVLFFGLHVGTELSWSGVGYSALFSAMVMPFVYGLAALVYMAVGTLAVIPVWMMSSALEEPVVAWLWTTSAIAFVLFLFAAMVVIDGP